MSTVNDDYTVQSLWNNIENAIINTTDFVAPIVCLPFCGSMLPNKVNAPRNMKSKINLRQGLLKADRTRNTNVHVEKIKSVSKEIHMRGPNKFYSNQNKNKLKNEFWSLGGTTELPIPLHNA